MCERCAHRVACRRQRACLARIRRRGGAQPAVDHLEQVRVLEAGVVEGEVSAVQNSGAWGWACGKWARQHATANDLMSWPERQFHIHNSLINLMLETAGQPSANGFWLGRRSASVNDAPPHEAVMRSDDAVHGIFPTANTWLATQHTTTSQSTLPMTRHSRRNGGENIALAHNFPLALEARRRTDRMDYSFSYEYSLRVILAHVKRHPSWPQGQRR